MSKNNHSSQVTLPNSEELNPYKDKGEKYLQSHVLFFSVRQ